MPRIFVGSSYFDRRQADRPEFLKIWIENTKRCFPNPTRVVLVAEAGSRIPFALPENYDVVNLSGDLGHVSMLERGEKKNAFAGWTGSMLALAMLAYCDEADFLYKESDCLAFGDIEGQMYRDLTDEGDIVFGHAHPVAPGMPSSQSLFLVRHRFIPEFVSTYISYGGDATIHGEHKMCKLRDRFGGARIRMLSFGQDRCRPIEWHRSPLYLQQIYPEELAEMKTRNLI